MVGVAPQLLSALTFNYRYINLCGISNFSCPELLKLTKTKFENKIYIKSIFSDMSEGSVTAVKVVWLLHMTQSVSKRKL